MIRLTLLILILPKLLFAFEISTKWSDSANKYLELSCRNSYECQEFCAGGQCQVQEKVCRNCIGTSISMSYAFQEMGRAYVSSYELDEYFLFELLSRGEFVSLTSRSLYNLIDRFDSLVLRRKFQSLCRDGTQYPVVFFDATAAGELGEIQAVWCKSGVFKMETAILKSKRLLY